MKTLSLMCFALMDQRLVLSAMQERGKLWFRLLIIVSNHQRVVNRQPSSSSSMVIFDLDGCWTSIFKNSKNTKNGPARKLPFGRQPRAFLFVFAASR
jgi:hypothetical protein